MAGGVGIAGPSTAPDRRKVLEGVHVDRPLAAERGQALRLVKPLGVLPCHLEHDVASGAPSVPGATHKHRRPA